MQIGVPTDSGEERFFVSFRNTTPIGGFSLGDVEDHACLPLKSRRIQDEHSVSAGLREKQMRFAEDPVLGSRLDSQAHADMTDILGTLSCGPSRYSALRGD